MSCTLSARKKPKTRWPWYFKGSLRDKLRAKYNDCITPEAIPYLEGLRDNEGDDGYRNHLTEIINALYEGDEVELKYEC